MRKFDVVIIGAGIIGLTAAYFLTRLSRSKMALVERSPLPSGSTAHSAGFVTHQMWNPFNQVLAKRSVEVYREIERASQGRFLFQPVGAMITASRVSDAVRQEGVAESLRRLFVKVQMLGPDEVRSIMPGIKTKDIRVATFCPDDGCINPLEFLAVTSGIVRDSGRIEFVYDDALAVEKSDFGYSVRLAHRLIGCRKLVLAMGAWTNSFLSQFGLDLHTRVRRAQVVVTGMPPTWKGVPCYYDRSADFYLAPAGGASLFLGADGSLDETLEGPASFETSLDPSYRKIVLSRFKKRFGVNLEAKGGWAGVYTDSPDGLPLVGELSGYSGLFVGTGDIGLGLVMGPAIGECLACLVSGRRSRINHQPFDPDRFGTKGAKLGLLGRP